MREDLILARLDASAEADTVDDGYIALRDLVNDLIEERTKIRTAIGALPWSASLNQGLYTDPLAALDGFKAVLLQAAGEAQAVRDELAHLKSDIRAVQRVFGVDHPF